MCKGRRELHLYIYREGEMELEFKLNSNSQMTYFLIMEKNKKVGHIELMLKLFVLTMTEGKREMGIKLEKV